MQMGREEEGEETTRTRKSEWSSSSNNVRTTERIDGTKEKTEGQRRRRVVRMESKGEDGAHFPRKESV